MYQPNTVQYSGDYLYVVRHDAADYYARAPLVERLNPLRYEVVLLLRPKPLRINQGGKWYRAWSDATWRARHLLREVRGWFYVRLRREVQAKTCMTGKCWCADAGQCFFSRCPNCDGLRDDDGLHIDTGRWVEEHNRCPECGGALHPL